VDDHVFIRCGVKGILEDFPEWNVCGEADNGSDAIRLATELKPDVVLLDVSMPGITGLDAARTIREADQQVKVILLTLHDSQELIRAAFRVGVNGYLLKTDAERELLRALRVVTGDGVYLSPHINGDVVRSVIGEKPVSAQPS
jgi:DNA-binding NarL/FixJ family response regulator